jgi:hypothetical protein
LKTHRLPILILAGSDQRTGPVGPGLDANAMLSGFKGALPLPSGKCLAAELIERIRRTERFEDPILFGPRSVYGGLVDCEVIDVEGSLAATLSRVLGLLRERFDRAQPVAISTCDILPTTAEFSELLETGYAPQNDCQFWWQIIAAEPEELGASEWKPNYVLQPAPGAALQTVYPGHLVILRPEALRLELLNRLLVVAYRYRNWPLRKRFLPMLFRGLGLLMRQDLENLGRLQLPILTCSIPWHILRAYQGIRNRTLSLPDFERHLARTVVHRRFRSGRKPFAITITRSLSFAKDIDTLAELQEVVAAQSPAVPPSPEG